MKNNQKGIAPIIIALIVAVVLGGGYLIVKQQGKKAEVPIISTDIFKNSTYRLAFSAGKDAGIPKEFTMTNGFSSNSVKDLPLCNIGGLGIENELAIAMIDQNQARGVVAIYCNYGASLTDVFLVAFKSLNGVPVQTDAVDLRLHPDLSSRNLFRVGVKQIALDANGALTVTALVVPDALRNAPGVQQNASESVAISYSLDNQGKLMSTSTPATDTSDWKTYTNTQYGFTFEYPLSVTIDLVNSNLSEKIIHQYDNYPLGPNHPVDVTSKIIISGRLAYEYDLVSSVNYKIHGIMIPLDKKSFIEISENSKNPLTTSSDWKKIISTFANLQDSVSDVSIVDTSDWKTYTNIKQGYSFQYPEKLSISTSGEVVNLSHSITFDNYGGGCDMKGDAKLSKMLGDFGLSIKIVSGQVSPPYVDGNYSKGVLDGKWSYMGAEGCGQTNYYFPITGNRTLVVTKNEIQMLSPVVAPDVRAKVLAVPGVISYEESKVILDQIFSTFKFTK